MILLNYQNIALEKQMDLAVDIKNKCKMIFGKADLVYLFGSYAKGTNNKLSDIDFAFLFDDKYNNSKLFDLRLEKKGKESN